MKYEVVKSKYVDDLGDLVNDLISKGYKPLGGVNCATDGSQVNYVQSMILEDEETDSVWS